MARIEIDTSWGKLVGTNPMSRGIGSLTHFGDNTTCSANTNPNPNTDPTRTTTKPNLRHRTTDTNTRASSDSYNWRKGGSGKTKGIEISTERARRISKEKAKNRGTTLTNSNRESCQPRGHEPDWKRKIISHESSGSIRLFRNSSGGAWAGNHSTIRYFLWIGRMVSTSTVGSIGTIGIQAQRSYHDSKVFNWCCQAVWTTKNW